MGPALSGGTFSCCGAFGEFETSLEEAAWSRSNACSSTSSHGYQPRRPEFERGAAGGQVGDAHLPLHRRKREKTRDALDFLADALRTSVVCAMLDGSDIDSLTRELEFHVFDEGEVVTHAGTVGGCFFVADSGGLEVWMHGVRTATIPRGQTFGEEALLLLQPSRVSVVATRPGVGVWAADYRPFRHAIQASVMQQLSDCRAFLDALPCFETFGPRQMDDVADAAELQVCNVGDVPARLGRDDHCAFFVKTGKLRILAGGVQEGRADDVFLGPRSCICERTLLYDEPSSITVEAVKRCELVRLDLQRLRALLGQVLCPVRLQRAFLRRVLQKSNLFSHWSASQLALACESMEFVEIAPDSKGMLPLSFFVVLDGSARLGIGNKAQWFRRGHWYRAGIAANSTKAPPPAALVAGHDGCRLAVLTVDEADGGVSPPRRKDSDRSRAHMDRIRSKACLREPDLELKHLRRLGKIGCGTSGVVHLVQHKVSNSTYALKRVCKKDGRIPRQVRREIEVLTENDHPFIMQLVKALEMPDCVYLITEYVSGGELHAAIRSIPTVLSRPQAMFYTGSMVLMLEALYERDVVYRDLKPENLMLDCRGYLKLIDFGSAKKLVRSCLRTFTMVGTPHYMAPEVMRGKGYGTEVDVWAMGVILYELVCGYLPFGDNCESTGDVCKAVLAGDLQFPPNLEEITRDLITGLLVPKPHKRLGCNAHGYDEIKEMPFFSLEGLILDGLDAQERDSKRPDFFMLLIDRELQVPIPPSFQEPELLKDDGGGDGFTSDGGIPDDDQD